MQQYKFKISELDFEPVAILADGSDEQKTLLALHTGKKTIAQLVATVNLAGAHEIHERPRKATTTRKMYQIIRNLREAGCPIVGDPDGIYIASSVQDVIDFAYNLEKKAKADIASMMDLRKQMLSIVKREQKSLFDSIEF